jgi:peptide deformylase
MTYQPKALKILTYGHPTLRVKCAPVTEFNEELKQLAEDMFLTMVESDGVGLAASQVDRKIQLLVIGVPQKDSDDLLEMAVVNPVILESGGSWDYEEGCLSFPDLRNTVTRPEWIKLQYQDLDGKTHILDAAGMLSRVLQHEIDHLNGILFIDRLTAIRRALMNNKLKQMAREGAQSCM